MAVKFNSSGGGSVLLDAPSTASNLTVTLPSASGTLTTTSGSTFADITVTGNSYFATSSGNVGVGTSSPGGKLGVQVSSGAGVQAYKSTTGGFAAYQLYTANENVIGTVGVGTTNDTFYLGYSTTPVLTWNSSGIVGIGTSSPVPWTKLQINGSAGAQTGAYQQLSINAPTTVVSEGVGIRLSASSGAKEAVGIVGVVNEASGNLGAMTFHVYNGGATVPEYMRIDSSGNVGIGTSSPAQKLDVVGLFFEGADSRTNNTNKLFGLRMPNYANATASVNLIGAVSYSNANQIFIGGNDTNFGGTAATSIQFYTAANSTTASGTERARIDSSGNLLVGTTNSSVTSGSGIKIKPGDSGDFGVSIVSSASTSAGSSFEMYSTGAAAWRFYVSWDGKINATSTTIAAISDQRLKENIRDLDFGLSEIMSLQPRRFDWKEGKGTNTKDAVGFIAQEFETVFPASVGLSKAGEDGVEYKNICHEELIPTLVKAIQELKAELDATKAEVAALKGAA